MSIFHRNEALDSGVLDTSLPNRTTPNTKSYLIDRELFLTADRFRGMIFGTAVGDALGFPVETKTACEIKKAFGNITEFKEVKDNPFVPKGAPAGTYTDDTQLTLAIVRALSRRKAIDLTAIATEHIEDLNQTTMGWGSTTRKAVMNLKNGLTYEESGNIEGRNIGVGNGVVMKIAPLAFALGVLNIERDVAENYISLLTCMTHRTKVALLASFAHVGAVQSCLAQSSKSFSTDSFIQDVINLAESAKNRFGSDAAGDTFLKRLSLLPKFNSLSDHEIETRFNNGSCYVADSLVFTYMHFLKHLNGADSIYVLANAGGDTDSNASMAGALVGALNGIKAIPQNLIDNLVKKEEIRQQVEEFINAFSL